MVVKAIINAVTKGASKQKPRMFPEGTEKFTKEQATTLLEEGQKKIEQIQTGNAKAIDTGSLVPEDVNPLTVKANVVAPNLTPTKVINTKVAAPKPSSKRSVDEFFTEEEKILKNSDLSGQEDNFLNFNTIQTTDDIYASINALGNQLKKVRPKTGTSKLQQQTRGVVSWKETNELATLLGENAETLAGNLLKLKPGTVLNAHEIKAAKNLLINQHKKLTQLSAKLASEGGDTTKVALEFAQQHALTAEITKIFKGAQTEIARSLNILKEPIQDGAVKNLDLDRLNRDNILMNLGGKDQIKLIAQAYQETPGLANKIKFAEKSFGAKASDAAVEVFLNNILIGVLTHIKNNGGNWIYKTIERLERKYAARLYGGSTLDSVAEFEDIALAFGENMAMTGMWRAFSQKFKSLKPLSSNPLKTYKNLPGIENKVAGTKFESPVNAFSSEAFGMEKDSIFSKAVDVLGRALTIDRLSYRFLQFSDNIFKNTAYNSELYASAFRDTVKQVKLGNLSMAKAPDYLASLVTNPTEQMTKAAYDTALRRSFQTPLSKRGDIVGDLTNAVQQTKNVKALNPITILSSQYFTFLRTPGNIVGATAERLPYLGTNRLLRSYREALSKGGAEAEIAKAKAATGWAFLATFGPLGYFGIFSGSDPGVRGRDNYELRKSANMQPKSFRFDNFLSEDLQELFGLQGSKIQISLNGFEPAIMLAAIAADIGNIIARIQEDWSGWKNIEKVFYDFLSAYALSFGDNILNTSVLNGAGRLSDLVSNMKMSDNPSEVIWKEGKKIVSGLVPFQTLLNQFEDFGSDKVETNNYGIANADDFRKLNFEFKSMIQKNIPGFENDLYFDRDWLGQESPKFSVISSMTEDPINKEARMIGYQPIKLRQKYPVTAYSTKYGETDYGIPVNVKLTEQEYSLLNRIQGNQIKIELNDLMNSSFYKNSKDRTDKLNQFKDAIETAKKNTKGIFEAQEIYLDIEARAEILATKKWRDQQKNQAILNDN